MRDPDGPEHVYAEAPHCRICGEIGRADTRFGGAGVVDDNVEPPVLAPDPVCGCCDACVAGGVDLEEHSPEFVGRPLPALCVTRPDEYGVAYL